MNQDLLETLRVVALPTATNFRGITLREVALFEGEQGWAEFSPFLEYDDQECVPWLACAIEAATKPAPKLFRQLVPINGTIPALNDEAELISVIDSFPEVSTFKIKVGNNVAEDLARIKFVRKISPDSLIRIDVNGLWNVTQAVDFINQAGPLEYVEQPCASIEELRQVKKLVDVKIVGDEIIRKAIDPFTVDLQGAVDILMLKAQPLGGIKRAHEIAAHHKIPVVISSALESAVGINYGLILAASFEVMSYDCGLGTGSLLTRNVAQLPITDGKIALSKVEPNFDGLEVSSERFDWWKNRIMRTAALL